MSTATRMDIETKTLPEAWRRVDEQLAQLDAEQRATANVMVYLHHNDGVMLRLEYCISATKSNATTVKRQHPEIDSRSASLPPVPAGNHETATPDPLSSVLLRELDQTEGVNDLCAFIRTHSLEDVTAVCRSYPIDGIRLDWHGVGDLTSEPAMRDIRRFELITTLAQILVRYEANLKLPELRLPKSLPANKLENLLLARLMP